MAENKKEVKTETVKLLGKDCTVQIISGNIEKIQMKKDDFNAVLDEKGVTKEVRAAVKKAHDEIAKEVLEFQSDRLLKLNKGVKESDPKFIKKSEIVLGSGDGSIESELTAHRIHKYADPDDRTKQLEKHTYGQARMTLNYAWAKEVKQAGGLLSQIAEKFEKQLGGKK